MSYIEGGILLDHIWKGQHASYRYRRPDGRLHVASWFRIKEQWRGLLTD